MNRSRGGESNPLPFFHTIIMSNTITSPKNVRRYLLDCAKASRHHTFTQVRQETLDKVEAAARSAAKAHVMSVPSKGKTL